jgi:hypothetical protein
MKLLTDEATGEVLSNDAYSLVTPSLLCGILKDYITKHDLWSVFSSCLANDRSSFAGSNNMITSCGLFSWEMLRRPLPNDCNLHWIAPADNNTHMDLLKHLGSSGFDMVLQALGTVSDASVKNLVVYQLTFIIVSFCGSFRLHLDNEPSLSGRAWTVIVPLQLVRSSPPELIIRPSGSRTLHTVKYEYDKLVIFGPMTDHATGIVSYTAGDRVCLAVSVGFISNETMNDVMLGESSSGMGGAPP